MFINAKLEKLINGITNQNCNREISSLELVEQLYTMSGDDYYCIKENFCFPNSRDSVVRMSGCELSNYEWDGNEVFVSEHSIDQVITKAIGFVKQLKEYLHTNFPSASFDIILSLDIEDPNMPPSATIRFYKVRENYHIITVEKMDDYSQPVGICQLSERTTDVPLIL